VNIIEQTRVLEKFSKQLNIENYSNQTIKTYLSAQNSFKSMFLNIKK